ncbi:hypothetical protein ABT364_23085 [Massilia sp. SR12]
MLNYRKLHLAAALLLPALPAFATTVPGDGADKLAAILFSSLIGGAVGGLWAFFVKNSDYPLISFFSPLLVIPAFIVAVNKDLDGDNYFAIVLLCAVPYLIIYSLCALAARWRARAARHALGKQYISRPGLVPSDAALPQLRDLLAKEVEAEKLGRGPIADLALLCSIQLFGRGQLQDVLRIWEAKNASKTLGRKLDARLLCGAGLHATKAFLATQAGSEAAAALRYLEEREEAGDFAEFTTQSHLDGYRSYFGLEPT